MLKVLHYEIDPGIFYKRVVFILVPMKYFLILFSIFFQLITAAQTREEIFDFQFQPTKRGGYYYVVTEKKDSLWNRKAWFIAQKTLYMQGSYKDESCKIEQGEFKWYHSNGYLKTNVTYVDGLREGAFLGFDEHGSIKDSLNYRSVDGSELGIAYMQMDIWRFDTIDHREYRSQVV